VYLIPALLAFGIACTDSLSVIWVLSLPLRLVGITTVAAFALIRALLLFPARLLGWRRRECHAG
jgi:hypothetical protein